MQFVLVADIATWLIFVVKVDACTCMCYVTDVGTWVIKCHYEYFDLTTIYECTLQDV